MFFERLMHLQPHWLQKRPTGQSEPGWQIDGREKGDAGLSSLMFMWKGVGGMTADKPPNTTRLQALQQSGGASRVLSAAAATLSRELLIWGGRRKLVTCIFCIYNISRVDSLVQTMEANWFLKHQHVVHNYVWLRPRWLWEKDKAVHHTNVPLAIFITISLHFCIRSVSSHKHRMNNQCA